MMTSNKQCPECGCGDIVPLRSTDEKFCPVCEVWIKWPLDSDQKPLVSANRIGVREEMTEETNVEDEYRMLREARQQMEANEMSELIREAAGAMGKATERILELEAELANTKRELANAKFPPTPVAPKQVDWSQCAAHVVIMCDDRYTIRHCAVSSFPMETEITFAYGFLMGWQGGECPLPEGVNVVMHLRDGRTLSGPATEFGWEHIDHCDGSDIVGYSVSGLADGWEV